VLPWPKGWASLTRPLFNRIEINGDRALVKRELEGGIEEIVELKLPAVLTIQTGINEPKYVSLSAIMEAEDKELKETTLRRWGSLKKGPLDVTTDQVSFPPSGKRAEMLKGKSRGRRCPIDGDHQKEKRLMKSEPLVMVFFTARD